MRCGRNLDIKSDRRAEFRTSQSSNCLAAHPSCGSTMSIPSACEPASVQCLARNPPMKPAAPVIITFMPADLYAPTEFQPARHSRESFVLEDTAREFRCRCTCPNDGMPGCFFLQLAIAELAVPQARRVGWAASRTEFSWPPYRFRHSRIAYRLRTASP